MKNKNVNARDIKGSALDAVEGCLECLYGDDNHVLQDTVASGSGGLNVLTYEELITALLLAHKELNLAILDAVTDPALLDPELEG